MIKVATKHWFCFNEKVIDVNWNDKMYKLNCGSNSENVTITVSFLLIHSCTECSFRILFPFSGGLMVSGTGVRYPAPLQMSGSPLETKLLSGEENHTESARGLKRLKLTNSQLKATSLIAWPRRGSNPRRCRWMNTSHQYRSRGWIPGIGGQGGSPPKFLKTDKS